MLFSFGRKSSGYDDDRDEMEYYDEDGFQQMTLYNMYDSTAVPKFNTNKSSRIKSKIKQIKENSRKQQ